MRIRSHHDFYAQFFRTTQMYIREIEAFVRCIELNTSHERLDLPDVHLRRAKELGVKIVMGSDAHSTKGFDYRFGILQARRGWLEKGDVVNTLPFTEFFKIVG